MTFRADWHNCEINYKTRHCTAPANVNLEIMNATNGMSVMNARGVDRSGIIPLTRMAAEKLRVVTTVTTQGTVGTALRGCMALADTGHGGQSQSGTTGRVGIRDESPPSPCKRFQTWHELGRRVPVVPAAEMPGVGNLLGKTRTTICLP